MAYCLKEKKKFFFSGPFLHLPDMEGGYCWWEESLFPFFVAAAAVAAVAVISSSSPSHSPT